ncbi:hypothetical protein QT19_00025, partial [Staphylococcus aureus]
LLRGAGSCADRRAGNLCRSRADRRLSGAAAPAARTLYRCEPRQYRDACELRVRPASRLCLSHAAAGLEPGARDAVLRGVSVPGAAGTADGLGAGRACGSGRGTGAGRARAPSWARFSDACLPAAQAAP